MLHNSPLLLSILYYILLIPIDAIAYIQWINALINYKWLASSIIFPLISILSFGSVTLWHKIHGKLNQNNKDICQKKLFIIGLLDSLSTIISSMTLPYISIIVSITLCKIAMPITMIFSYYLLDKRYHVNHYIAVFIILIGVMLTIVPYLQNNSVNNPFALCVYIFSIIPTVLSDIYKERILKKNLEINLYWMNTYISIWQLIIGITTTPIIFIYLTYAYDNPINFINYINNGIQCQMAISSNYNCNKSLFWLVIYQFISTTTSTLSFIIIKYGSATILIILTNIKIPLTCFISYILINYNFIYTTTLQRMEMSIHNYISIILLVIGAFIYNYKPEYTRKKNISEEYLLGPL